MLSHKNRLLWEVSFYQGFLWYPSPSLQRAISYPTGILPDGILVALAFWNELTLPFLISYRWYFLELRDLFY